MSLLILARRGCFGRRQRSGLWGDKRDLPLVLVNRGSAFAVKEYIDHEGIMQVGGLSFTAFIDFRDLLAASFDSLLCAFLVFRDFAATSCDFILSCPPHLLPLTSGQERDRQSWQIASVRATSWNPHVLPAVTGKEVVCGPEYSLLNNGLWTTYRLVARFVSDLLGQASGTAPGNPMPGCLGLF